MNDDSIYGIIKYYYPMVGQVMNLTPPPEPHKSIATKKVMYMFRIITCNTDLRFVSNLACNFVVLSKRFLVPL